MAFRVGQKVVLINNTPDRGYRIYPEDRPFFIKGDIFTISEVGLRGSGYHDEPCLRLKELRWKYRQSRFRPVVEKSTETGMAILRKILKTQKVEERA